MGYVRQPVDAMSGQRFQKGMRTLFEGFHQFRPEQAQAILGDGARQGVAIGGFLG